MNERDYVISRLKQYSADQISISSHAKIRLAQRQISEKEVIENLIKPNRLEYAIREESQDQKFDCYFGYTQNLCHRYVIEFTDQVIVVTVIKISKKWQRIAEKKLSKSMRR